MRIAGTGRVTVNVAPWSSPGARRRRLPPCSSTRCARWTARGRARSGPGPESSPPGGNVEDEGEEFRADALAGVADPELHEVLRAAQPDFDAAAARRELDGVREQVPGDLLHAVRIAQDGGDRVVVHVSSRAIPLASAAALTVSTAASTTGSRSIRRDVRRSLPVVIRAASRRSSTSRACAWTLRWIAASPRAAVAASTLSGAST